MSQEFTNDGIELIRATNDLTERPAGAPNAWRHGMYARRLVVGEEDAGGFEGLRAALVEQWRPRSATAWVLVDHLARLQWRLMRAGESEAQVVQDTAGRVRAFDGGTRQRPEPLAAAAAVATALSGSRSGLERLQLFQMRLERSMFRTITMLQTLRKSRGRQGKGRAAGAGGKPT